MALITDLPASTSLASTDLLIKDTGSTTQKITASNLLSNTITGNGTEFNGDLNTLTTAGVYRITSWSSATNTPTVSGSSIVGQLFVIPRSTTSRMFQLMLVYTTDNSFMFIRAMNGASTWQSWAALYSSANPVIIRGTYTTTSGAIIISDSRITSSSNIFVQNRYASNASQLKYTFTIQATSGGMNVYVRDGSGSFPADNASFALTFLVFN